jgi:hypothetical protein
MIDWWSGLTTLNQAFFAAAIFFSTLFAWQFVASVSGVTGTGDVDVDADADVDFDMGDADGGVDSVDSDLVEDASGLATFRLLSFRSLLAFGTLFSWAGALYLQQDTMPWLALVRSLLWGLAGMAVVAFFFWVLPRLTEEGTASLETAVGRSGQVYLNIPEDGVGQIRVLVGNSVNFVKARTRSGRHLPAGAMVRVVGLLDNATLEVEQIES